MRNQEISHADLKDMQDVILNILKAIDQVCRQHGLTYYIVAGTQLGAVRHGGFIPWDDDADVGMPRPDYEEFIAHANEWLPAEYRLVDGTKDPNYPYAFARVHDIRTTYLLYRGFDYYTGVPVDVFPLDGMTTDAKARRRHYRRYHRAIKRLYYATVDPYKHGHGIYALLVKTLKRFFDPAKQHAAVDAIQREFPYTSSPLVADHDNKPQKGVLPKEVYGTPVEYDFSGTRLNGVAIPDEYLKCCYGDYMKPVVAPHLNFRELSLDKSYLDKPCRGHHP